MSEMIDLTMNNAEIVSNAVDMQCSFSMNFHAQVSHNMQYNTNLKF